MTSLTRFAVGSCLAARTLTHVHANHVTARASVTGITRTLVHIWQTTTYDTVTIQTAPTSTSMYTLLKRMNNIVAFRILIHCCHCRRYHYS